MNVSNCNSEAVIECHPLCSGKRPLNATQKFYYPSPSKERALFGTATGVYSEEAGDLRLFHSKVWHLLSPGILVVFSDGLPLTGSASCHLTLLNCYGRIYLLCFPFLPGQHPRFATTHQQSLSAGTRRTVFWGFVSVQHS